MLLKTLGGCSVLQHLDFLAHSPLPPDYLFILVFPPCRWFSGLLFSKGIRRAVSAKADQSRPQLAKEVVTCCDSLSLSIASENLF